MESETYLLIKIHLSERGIKLVFSFASCPNVYFYMPFLADLDYYFSLDLPMQVTHAAILILLVYAGTRDPFHTNLSAFAVIQALDSTRICNSARASAIQ